MAANSSEAERGGDCGLAGRKPLIPENIKDELDMVYHFTEEFKNRYGETHMPAFKIAHLESILTNAKKGPVRERKPVAVYLHHDNSTLSDLFCSKGLCSADVVTYLNKNFVVFGWDMTSRKIKRRIRQPLSVHVGYSLAVKVKELTEEQLPLLLTLTFIHTSWGVDPNVISYINGTSNGTDILNCLIQTKKVFDDNHVIALQRLEEKECRDSVWSIPWKHVPQDETLELERKKEDQESNSTLESQKKALKELEQIVSDGNLVKLHAIRDQGGDLSGCVTTPYHENMTICLLALAAWNGHTHLLDTLIESGLSVEGSGSTNWTPLMLAARKAHEEMVEELLSRGADPLARDSEGAVALHHAAFCGHRQCVAALIPVTPTTIADSEGRTPIHAASLRGHKHVIEDLNDKGWKLGIADSGGNTELHMSAWFGSLEVVEYLVAAKLNPYQKNMQGLTPLNLAVREGRHNIESWFMKRRGGSSLKLLHAHELIKSQEENEKDNYESFKKYVKYGNVAGIEEMKVIGDAHLMDERGMTFLHCALEENYVKPSVVEQLLDMVHPHVMTYDGLTPLDLAKKKLKCNEGTISYPLYEEAISILENHQCSKEKGSPEELYTKLLQVICEGDNVKEVSRLMCAGAPLELNGDFPNSALQQAIIHDRSKIVNLMLASQASLIPCTQGLNLLQHAWYSPNTSARVYFAITKAFSRELKRERDRLPRHTSGLRYDLTELIEAVDGDAPWEACWKMGNSKKENLGDKTTADEGARWEACWQKGSTAKKKKLDERTTDKLTSFMVIATRANCPLIASFLQRAGAWSYFNAAGTTPLHAALKTGNLNLAETMVRNLGASLYIPDSEHSLPKDIIGKMDAAKLKKLEEEVYKREKRKLENLEIFTKDESEKEKVRMLLALQEALFTKYTGNTVHPTPGNLSSIDQEAGAYAMLIASRSGLQQLLHLLLVMECLPADLVVDGTAGTTALHEAASHGKSRSVVQLLHSLEKAAVASKHNVAEAKAYSGHGHSVLWKLNRYSPLQPDRYGQTALHLAAMFGHKHTLELLVHFVGEDPPCRAGTTAKQILSNFTGYLKRYLRYNDKTRNKITPLDHHDPDALLSKLLCAVDLNKLPKDAKRANVDMDSGEARQVKDAVLKAVGVILGRVVMADDMYQGRLRLVGSARDGSKLFAPDEFDINVVIPAADRVNISVEQEMDAFKSNVLKINVETNNPHLQGNRLMGDLFGLVKEVLTDSVLDDDRLSVVPPSLTRTQVGVSLALAWQGVEYPLLLVGVDLVPVLEVPWHEAIVKPDALTPPDSHYMHVSNTSDGSWRCSFALLEAEVLRQLSLEERCIQLSCKMLLYHLKAERWMPREIKAFCTWWSGRSFNVPVPAGFCLKSSFFGALAYKRKYRLEWSEGDTIRWMLFIFRRMCLVEEESNTFSPKKVFAYFGGDCEGPKFGAGAPVIAKYLKGNGLKKKYIMRSFRQHLNYWINTFLKLIHFPNMR